VFQPGGNENADGMNVNEVNEVGGEEGVDEERGKGPVSSCRNSIFVARAQLSHRRLLRAASLPLPQLFHKGASSTASLLLYIKLHKAYGILRPSSKVVMHDGCRGWRLNHNPGNQTGAANRDAA
jgi:hypothetical protein